MLVRVVWTDPDRSDDQMDQMTTPNSRAGLELFWFNIPGAQRNFVNKFNKPHSHHARTHSAITAP
jgi:hypothetical protein